MAERVVAVDRHWPQWRGPQGTGVAPSGNYPVHFSQDDALAWKIKLSGVGSSTPAVWGDRIFVTCGAEGRNAVCAFDMQGQVIWEERLGEEIAGKHQNASGSNPSPVVDERHVVAYFKSGEIAALDHDGKVLWRRNLQEEYGPSTLWWDLGTSPVLHDGKVIVAVMHEGDSYLAAIDVQTGENIWKQPRQYQRPQESDQAYTTPQLAEVNGTSMLVAWGADHLTGHDLSTGALLWDCAGFNPSNEGMWRVIASPVVADGLAVVPYGRGKFLAAVELDGNGDVTQTHRRWQKTDLGADVPTPVIDQGRIYLLGDSGSLTCLSLATGDQVWNSKLPKSRHKFYASAVLAGDMLYCTREDGTLFVGRLGDDGFELLAENALNEQVIATPVPIRDGLLVRGHEHLYFFQSPDAVSAR